MINSIVTNLTSLAIRNNLNKSNSNISCTLERLASGLKINRAKDDTSDCVISAKNNIQLSGLDIANQNAMQGISILNIADSALENMTKKVMRIRDLSMQALNSTYSKEELNVIQNEINELILEINREKETTSYNEKKIFEPSVEKTEEIKPPEKPYAYEVEYLESNGSQCINTSIAVSELNSDKANWEMEFEITNNSYTQVLLGTHVAPNGQGSTKTEKQIVLINKNLRADWAENAQNTIGSCSTNVKHTLSQKDGYLLYDGTEVKEITKNTTCADPIGIFDKTYNYNGSITTKPQDKLGSSMKLYSFKVTDLSSNTLHDFIPVIDNNNVACMYDKITGQFFYNQGTGDFKIGHIIPPEKSEFITTSIDNSTTLQIGQNAGEDNTVTVDLGFNLDSFDIDVTSINSTKVAIQKCSELIDVFSLRRSQVGSNMNRIDSILKLQDIQKVNLSATNSLIKDSDIAQESANLTREQILQQVSSSLFSQANQMTNNLAPRLLGL